MARSYLEFSSPAWFPWSIADKEILEKVQKRPVSKVSGLQSYEEKLKELNLPTQR